MSIPPTNRPGGKSQPKVGASKRTSGGPSSRRLRAAAGAANQESSAPRAEARDRRNELAKMLMGAVGTQGRETAPPQRRGSAPAARPPSQPRIIVSRSEPPKSVRSGAVGDRSGPVVLVVDDDDDIRDLVTRSLSKDHLVYQAGDGQNALDVLRKIGSVDLIVSDVAMPKLDGLGLARAVKADAKLRGVPIIFLTARTTVSDHVAAIGVGARSYLAKPFSMKDLRQAVSRATRRGPARG